MQINSKSIKKRFEKSMDKYDENALVQSELAQKLTLELAKINTKFDNILELGCGTGILTKEIKKHFGYKGYYANDLVEKSKNYIAKILPQYTFIHGNAQKIKPTKKFDLIISNAMFQWFSDIEELIKYYKNFLTEKGVLAFSTFGPENFREIKDLSGLSLNYKNKQELINIISKDYEILYTDEYRVTLDFENPLALLAHMKNTGVNSLTAKTWTVREVKEFCEKYLKKYNEVKLTYHPILIIAKVKSASK